MLQYLSGRHSVYLVSVCANDGDGGVMYVRLVTRYFSLLLFGCYFPYNDHNSDYLDAVVKSLGYIESAISINLGFGICMLGDLNFDCTTMFHMMTWCLILQNHYAIIHTTTCH